MSFITMASTRPASTSSIIARKPGRSKRVPDTPSSVEWVGFGSPFRRAKSSNILFLRRDLSRSVFAKQCAIRIDKQQKERYNNIVIDNDVII